jgi:hypothetical protein
MQKKNAHKHTLTHTPLEKKYLSILLLMQYYHRRGGRIIP